MPLLLLNIQYFTPEASITKRKTTLPIMFRISQKSQHVPETNTVGHSKMEFNNFTFYDYSCLALAWALSQHTDTSKTTEAWSVTQHTDTSKNTKAWAVSQHADTSKNTKCCCALNSCVRTLFIHNTFVCITASIHLPEMKGKIL